MHGSDGDGSDCGGRVVGSDVGAGFWGGGAAVVADAGELGAPPAADSGTYDGSSPLGDFDFSSSGEAVADG